VGRASLSVVVRIWLCLLGPATAAVQASGSPNDFVATGSMATPRHCHTATLLPDGWVLITGGRTIDEADTNSAELYIPSEGTFTSTGTMATAHSCHTATLLQDGRVLITGGVHTTIAELYDPQTGTFTATGEMHQFGGTATLLDSGQVLIAGGFIDQAGLLPVANPELYDPTTGTFTATGAFAGELIYVSSASLLPDGRVLIAAEPKAELYDPATGTFSLTGPMTTPCTPHGGQPNYIYGRTATVLMNGMVLVAGGENEDCGRFANAELYDASAGTFTATGTMTRRRSSHTATLLPDGTVLIAGGETEDCSPGGCIFSGTTTSTESYAPSTGTFVTVGDMTDRRGGHSATLLNDGTVLIAGGYCYAGIGQFCGVFASAELSTPPVLMPAPALLSVSGDGRGWH
jgi:hypothetical protein